MRTNMAVVTPSPQDDRREYYPIRTVASLTGVNSITLRTWEKRYGLIKPYRTPKGHRLYTQQDIDLINEVVALLDKGIPISQVSRTLQARQESDQDTETNPWQVYIQKMVSAISRFDEDALNHLYNEVLALYPIDIVTHKLIVPLLIEIGRRWEIQEGAIAEEHFFGVFLRNKLGARFHHGITNASGPRLLAACLPGETHENGLLLFALSAQSRGLRITVLGVNMPMNEIAIAAARSRADAIVLSGSANLELDRLVEHIRKLVDQVTIPVFIGGKASAIYHDEILRAGAIPVGDEITTGIKHILANLPES